MTAPKIYACYRRLDNDHFVSRVVDELRFCFGDETVFHDLDTIPLGGNWPESLESALASSSVILVFIGKNWHQSWDDDHGPRLWNSRDWVRKEICAGIDAEGKTILPVLIDDAVLPKRTSLPPAIRKITEVQILRIQHSHYKADLEQLVKFVGATINAVDYVETWLELARMKVSQSSLKVPINKAPLRRGTS